MDSCNLCDGPLMFLGTLGSRDHYRCRNCGMDQSCVADDETDECDDDGRFATDAEADEDAVDAEGEDDSREDWDGFNSDAEADADVLRSAGWGTDEDYGYFGGDD